MNGPTFLLTVAFLAAFGAAMGFFAGRMDARDSAPSMADPTQTSSPPAGELLGRDEALVANPRTDLLRALERPVAERDRAIRVAMNGWLAAEGAAAIVAARNDPDLGYVANRMTQLALFAYPEIFIDHPSLFEGIPDAEQSIGIAASAIVMFDPDAARGIVDTHLSDSIYRDAMLSTLDQIARAEHDPLAELESIVAGTGMGSQRRRLRQVVNRLAADDPVATAELVDDLPASLRKYGTEALVEIWYRTHPEEAASWLAEKSIQVSEYSLNRLARRWGRSDFEAANAFADTLTDRKRALFLTGLASATLRWSNEELLAWVSRYEGEPAYPQLMVTVAERLAQEDVGAAIELIETLPGRVRLESYRSVVRTIALRNPEAAIALLDEIGIESVRDEQVPMIASVWAKTDPESALDWARDVSPGPARDRAIASISSSLVNSETDFDIDRAIEVIDEIEDPEVRKNSVRPLLRAVANEDEAIRLGRDYGLDRAAVIALRKNRYSVRGPFLGSGDALVPTSDLE